MSAEVARRPGISIVTVALNAAEALPLTLESIVAQDYQDLESIIIDGGSWDDSNAVLNAYTNAVDRIVNVEDAGIYYAMNESLQHVTKEFVLFMNAGDQFYCADAVSRMAAALPGDPDIFYGNHIYVDRRIELFRRSAPFELLAQRLAEGRIDGPWLDKIPCHQATFTRTDLLRELRFDTRLKITADHDFLFRAYTAGARLQYVDEIVSHYMGGGFSQAAGERTKIEGASVYRQFSDRPDLVDKFFYPSAAPPYDPQTRRTGIKLGGFLPSEGWAAESDPSRGGEWIAEAGAELLSPARHSSGLELSGYNPLPNQRVSFFLGTQRVGDSPIPQDFFRVEIAFGLRIPPGSVIRMVADRTGLRGDREQALVGFAVRSFRFSNANGAASSGIPPESTLLFQSGDRQAFGPLLGGGWSEAEATHMWSLGAQSEIWLKLSADTQRFRLMVSGNPHVPGGDQQIDLTVNGSLCATARIDRGDRNVLGLECSNTAWRAGEINRLTLIPSAYCTPPQGSGDTRPLGFCLWRLEVE